MQGCYGWFADNKYGASVLPLLHDQDLAVALMKKNKISRKDLRILYDFYALFVVVSTHYFRPCLQLSHNVDDFAVSGES